MTIKTRQSGQPSRVLLQRNKAGQAQRTIEGNPSTPAERVGVPPLLMRLEGEIKSLLRRVDELERKAAGRG